MGTSPGTAGCLTTARSAAGSSSNARRSALIGSGMRAKTSGGFGAHGPRPSASTEHLTKNSWQATTNGGEWSVQPTLGIPLRSHEAAFHGAFHGLPEHNLTEHPRRIPSG